MTRSSTRRWGVAALIACALGCALVSAQAAVGLTAGSPDHRAVVLIDDGVNRRAHCVVFRGEITGLEALQATGARLVLDGFGTMGSAVCAINGVGCSSSSCLTCQLPDFWRYFRAGATDGSWQLSGAGGSTVTVRDGDRQAWVWGAQAQPGSVPSVDAVCGPRPTTTTRPVATVAPAPPPTPAATPPQPGPGPSSPAEPAPGPGGPAPSPGAPDEPPPTTAPDDEAGDDGDQAEEAEDEDRRSPDREQDTATTTDGPTDFTVVDAGDEQAAAPTPTGSSSEGGGGWWGVGLVGAVLAGLAGWAVRLRRSAAA